MVAMQMRDEDSADFRKAQPAAAQLNLRSLATVNEEQLATYLDDLR